VFNGIPWKLSDVKMSPFTLLKLKVFTNDFSSIVLNGIY
jgi:hypothetical protein